MDQPAESEVALAGRDNIPEATCEQFEIMFFGVFFDRTERRTGGLFVVCFLTGFRIVRHCEPIQTRSMECTNCRAGGTFLSAYKSKQQAMDDEQKDSKHRQANDGTVR